MRADEFLREIMQTASLLNDLIARYTHSFLTLTSQTAVCDRLHTIDERLCRWLKMTHDRVRRSEFSLRQEFITHMLGVHRPSVSIAASILQKAGLSRYSRGQMQILDPERLRQLPNRKRSGLSLAPQPKGCIRDVTRKRVPAY